jgi:lipid-A-disaccharide synthase-like uncharacterized protein
MPVMPATFFNISLLLGGLGFGFTITWHCVDSIEMAGSGICLVIYTFILFIVQYYPDLHSYLIIVTRKGKG